MLRRVYEWSLYRKEIEMCGARSADEAARALAELRGPHCFSRNRHGRMPFVGGLNGQEGKLCYAPDRVTPASRVLVFRIEADGDGCVLRGHLRVLRFVQVFTGAYLAFCIVTGVCSVFTAKARAQAISLTSGPLFVLEPLMIGLLFVFGYNGFTVLVP